MAYDRNRRYQESADPADAGGRGQRYRSRRRFVDLKLHEIDYRNERLLRRFLSDRGKILPRRTTGITALFQRRLTRAIKRARHLALLPYVAETYK